MTQARVEAVSQAAHVHVDIFAGGVPSDNQAKILRGYRKSWVRRMGGWLQIAVDARIFSAIQGTRSVRKQSAPSDRDGIRVSMGCRSGCQPFVVRQRHGPATDARHLSLQVQPTTDQVFYFGVLELLVAQGNQAQTQRDSFIIPPGPPGGE